MFGLVKQHMASDGYHSLLLLPLFSRATDLQSSVPDAASALLCWIHVLDPAWTAVLWILKQRIKGFVLK